jgi:hypothetical protein
MSSPVAVRIIRTARGYLVKGSPDLGSVCDV